MSPGGHPRSGQAAGATQRPPRSLRTATAARTESKANPAVHRAGRTASHQAADMDSTQTVAAANRQVAINAPTTIAEYAAFALGRVRLPSLLIGVASTERSGAVVPDGSISRYDKGDSADWTTSAMPRRAGAVATTRPKPSGKLDNFPAFVPNTGTLPYSFFGSVNRKSVRNVSVRIETEQRMDAAPHHPRRQSIIRRPSGRVSRQITQQRRRART